MKKECARQRDRLVLVLLSVVALSGVGAVGVVLSGYTWV